ncbi:MAG: hypothetical protein H2212_03670 [Ruminococcus sp.]|nr:hypothetical protein [Ruminococcus sp.]
MANCMKYKLGFYLKEGVSEEIVNAMNALINDSGLRSNLSNAKFFKKEWDNLFVKYNGYPDLIKIFNFCDVNKRYYLEVNIENREERIDLLKSFLEWIVPYIDESSLADSRIGYLKKESVYDGSSIILSEGEISFVLDDCGYNGFGFII